ncbi:MAG TPA: glycosyltransferase [Solirubrobacteraceae bacterium]
MIAFVSCVGSPETHARRALPGLHRVGEPGSVAGQVTSDRSIFEAYNRALDHFGAFEDLEALVLMHEDVELFDRDFGERVRRALADPQVAVVGAVGAREVESLAWWHGEVAGLCFQAREAGRRVVVTELTLFHHTEGGLGDSDAFQAANRAFRAKWGFFPVDVEIAA